MPCRKLLMQQRTHCQELDSCTRLHSLHQESQVSTMPSALIAS